MNAKSPLGDARSFLLALGLDPDAPVARPLAADVARSLAPGEVVRPEGRDVDGEAVVGGLVCERVFAAGRLGRVELPVGVAHPLLAGARLEVVLLLPPDLRPRSPTGAADGPLHDRYRKLVNRRSRFARLLDLKAPDSIVEQESRMLTEAVHELMSTLATLVGLAPGPVVEGAPLPTLVTPEAQLLDVLTALAADPTDAEAARRVVPVAVAWLRGDRLYEQLVHGWADEVAPTMSQRKPVRAALTEALFATLDHGHPAWPPAARGAVDRVASSGALQAALDLAVEADDHPLRLGVLEAELGVGTARLEGLARLADAVGWTARVALAEHHLRAVHIGPALTWLSEAAALRQPHLFHRPVRPPPLPPLGPGEPAQTVSEVLSCLTLNGLLSGSTLSGLWRLARVVDPDAAALLQAHATTWTRRLAAPRTARACDELRDLGRYLTDADALAEAVAALDSGLEGWPAGRDRHLLENDLALAYGRTGRRSEELALLQRLVAELTAAGDPGVSTLQLNLGAALLQAGRADDAAAAYTGLLGGPFGTDAASGLAYAHLQRGDALSARDAVWAAWSSLDEAQVATPEGVRLAEPLVSALLALGDPAAVGVQERLLAAARARYGDQPPTWLEETNLGGVLASLGRFSEALPIFAEARRKQEAAFGATASHALRTRRMAIRAHRSLGEHAQADVLEAPLADLEAVQVEWAPFRLGLLGR